MDRIRRGSSWEFTGLGRQFPVTLKATERKFSLTVTGSDWSLEGSWVELWRLELPHKAGGLGVRDRSPGWPRAPCSWVLVGGRLISQNRLPPPSKEVTCQPKELHRLQRWWQSEPTWVLGFLRCPQGGPQPGEDFRGACPPPREGLKEAGPPSASCGGPGAFMPSSITADGGRSRSSSECPFSLPLGGSRFPHRPQRGPPGPGHHSFELMPGRVRGALGGRGPTPAWTEALGRKRQTGARGPLLAMMHGKKCVSVATLCVCVCVCVCV